MIKITNEHCWNFYLKIEEKLTKMLIESKGDSKKHTMIQLEILALADKLESTMSSTELYKEFEYFNNIRLPLFKKWLKSKSEETA